MPTSSFPPQKKSENQKTSSPDLPIFHIYGISLTWAHLFLIILTLVFFLIDLALPLGVAAGIAYVICIGFAAELGIPWVWGTAISSTLFILAGWELSPTGGEEWKVLSNRGLSLIAIGATTAATLRWLRMQDQLAKLNHTLEHQVQERTSNLTTANDALAQQILERQHIANRLQESQTRLALVIQGTSDGIWDWNIDENTFYFSPRFKELLGYRPEEFYDSLPTLHEHIHPQDISRLNVAFQEHLANQVPLDIEIRIHTKLGEYRWFRMRGQAVQSSTGQPIRMAGSLMDTTDERFARLRQNTQYAISTVLAEAPDFESAIPDILQTVCREMGWVVGSFWEADAGNRQLHCSAIVDMGSPPHPLFVQESQRTTFSGGVGLPGRAWTNRCPSWIWDVTRDANFPRAPLAIQEQLQGALAFPVTLEQGRLGVIEFFSPDPISPNSELLLSITVMGNQIGQFLQRKAVEAQLLGNKKELERTNQELLMARDIALAAAQAKSNFLATMSHEIRTPLNGIIGLTEILLADAVTPDHQELLKTIVSCGSALLQLINDILDFSKMEAGKLVLVSLDFHLRTTIEEVLNILAPRALSKHVDLIEFIEPSIPVVVRGDSQRLRQILMNLVGNAIKFTDSGDVTLLVTTTSIDSTNLNLRFTVRDTGIGIAPHHHGQLFQAFQQADSSMARKFEGTGLGLAITKQLVELMGGTIGFTSTEGEGSCFWCEIPFQQLPSATEASNQPSYQGLRICLASQSKTLRDILPHYLESWDIFCKTASSGFQALEILRQALRDSAGVDILMVDTSLSDFDPWTLGQTISADPTLSQIRLILLADLGTPELAQQAHLSGYKAHITKPIHYQPLYDSIRLALEGTDRKQRFACSNTIQVKPTLSLPENSLPQGRHILLVEDNEVNQRVAFRMLTSLYLRVDIAKNGQEALAALERKNYDMVFMDCQMPVMDGFETTRAIRAREVRGKGETKKTLSSNTLRISTHDMHRVVIVALTANAMPGARNRCLEAGMDDFLSKPMSLSQLEDIVRKWCPNVLPLSTNNQDIPAVDKKSSVSDPPAQTMGNTDFPILDVPILQNLDHLGEGEDADFLTQVIDQFLADLPRHVRAIGLAWDQQDADALAKAAHTCKGSSRTIGATALAEASYVLEMIGREGTLTASSEPIKNWEKEKERTQQALTEFRNQNTHQTNVSTLNP